MYLQVAASFGQPLGAFFGLQPLGAFFGLQPLGAFFGLQPLGAFLQPLGAFFAVLHFLLFGLGSPFSWAASSSSPTGASLNTTEVAISSARAT